MIPENNLLPYLGCEMEYFCLHVTFFCGTGKEKAIPTTLLASLRIWLQVKMTSKLLQ